MRRFVALLIIAAAVFAPAGQAHAHVLITDSTKARGAVLHISPDDDPVAGQPAVLFFDMQGQHVPYADGDVRLVVRGAGGTAVDVEVTVSGTLATAEYVFPVQGAYTLAYSVVSDGSTYLFEHSQRVSRGTLGDVSDENSYAWAEAVLLFSGLGLIVLSIVAVNRREAIAAQSRF